MDWVRIYMNINAYMSIDATKPVFRVSDKIIKKQHSQPQRLDKNSEVLVAWSKFKYDTNQFENSKGADQTARMRKLVYVLLFADPSHRAERPSFSIRKECQLLLFIILKILFAFLM